MIAHVSLLADDDNLLWRSFVIEKKISPKINLELEQSSRFYEQISKIKQSFSEINISYKINNNFKIEIPYRYAIFEKKTKSRLALSTTINHTDNLLNIKLANASPVKGAKNGKSPKGRD